MRKITYLFLLAIIPTAGVTVGKMAAERKKKYALTLEDMLEKEAGEVWTDEFYSTGRNSWKEYQDENIINLSGYMAQQEIPVNMENVRTVAESLVL